MKKQIHGAKKVGMAGKTADGIPYHFYQESNLHPCPYFFNRFLIVFHVFFRVFRRRAAGQGDGRRFFAGCVDPDPEKKREYLLLSG